MTSTTIDEALDLLLVAASRGAEFRLDGPAGFGLRPQSVLSPEERVRLRAALAGRASDVAHALAWRVAAMRGQVPCAAGPIPALVARPGVQSEAGRCSSCAESLADAPTCSRCALCALAAWLALADYPATVIA